MRRLADDYLSKPRLEEAGLLDPAGVARVFELHESESATAATQTQLDAIINHMLGVQILHRKFVAADVPALARARAAELGWT
jgi:asparagine synthase (glutamine-hydrolysing)